MQDFMRHVDRVDRLFLADIEKVEDIDDLLLSPRKYAVYAGDNVRKHADDFSTQHVVGEDTAYFEVIVR